MLKLGTTHLRNKLAIRLILGSLILFLSGLVASQTSPTPAQGQSNPSSAPQGTAPSPGQTPPAATPSGSQSPANPDAVPASPTPENHPATGQQNTAPPGEVPAGQASPEQAPPAAAQPGQSTPQSPTTTDSGVFVFRAESQEVTLHATVVDERNHLVTSLKKGDFAVFEDNQPQQIRSFRQEDIPVAIGIVIDNSGSMREKRAEVNKAALNLVRASNPDDQVFVVNFNDEYYLDQELTSDVKKLQGALEHVESRGGTALYDALVASWNDQLKSAKLQRKVLFVVTDGEDDASQTTLEQAVRQLQAENGPTVYAIGILGEEKNRKAKRALEALADRTGGIAFFPPTLGDVDEISRSVAHDIRSQYTITYAPTNPKTTGGFRAIHVDAHARQFKKLSVRTRSGYYPGQERGVGGGQ
jgi:Ca-activated chloride channel homolog